ncbi:Uncharacterized protein Adt_46919 [Abeliophyllum distichum]|uniref:Uncharacterized protein n=1 Tax=Abeliophyllum distichum TaxID=126358 RepID=A0ABD1NX05_9LAMI
MGTKRKAERGVKTAKEDKTSNASIETENTEEEMHLLNDNSKATDSITAKDIEHLNSNGLPSKREQSKTPYAVLRRSSRLMSSVQPIQSQVIDSVVQHVNLADGEKEEEPNVKQVSANPIMVEGNAEENVDDLVRSIHKHKPKNVKQVSERPIEGPSASINYKSLYIDSQKKVNFLMEENFELTKKLEFSRGKIEAYEKMKDLMASPKDVILINNSGKATKHMSDLLAQTNVGFCSSPTAAASQDVVDDLKNSSKQKKYSRREKKAR